MVPVPYKPCKNPLWNNPLLKPRIKPTPKTVPGTAIASIAVNSISALPLKLRFTTKYEIIIDKRAVKGEAINESKMESVKTR